MNQENKACILAGLQTSFVRTGKENNYMKISHLINLFNYYFLNSHKVRFVITNQTHSVGRVNTLGIQLIGRLDEDIQIIK